MIRKLNFDSDERGVSEVLGAILVFGILVVLLATIQTQAVPAQNQEIEFQHTLEVQGDFAQYHQAASQVTANGNEQSTAIKTGTDYPSRLLFFNPPAVQGSVRTTDSEPVQIENIESTGEVDDRIDPNIDDDKIELDSRSLEYEANYNELKQDPTIRYEYGILYTNYGDGTTVQNQGSIIDGTDINLIFQAGDYAETSTAEQSIDVQPVSAPARSVPIESSDDSNPIIIELPSALPEEQWNDLYGSSDSVQDITKTSPDTVRIKLDPSKDYSLRMSRIGLEKDVQRPDGYYIVPAGDKTKSVSEGGTTNVKYEVRDEYNNPVSNVTVDVESPAGTTVTKNTNSDGKITVPITPDSSGTQTATAYIQDQSNVDGCDTTPNSAKIERCKADFTIQATDLSINPGSGVRLTESYIDQDYLAEVDPGEEDNVSAVEQNSNVVKTTFYVTKSNSREIAAIRINVYSTDQNPPTTANMTNSNGDLVVGDIEIGGKFKTSSDWTNDPKTLESEQDRTYGFRFYNEGGSPRPVKDNDYFVLTVVYQNDERAIYFVSPDGSGE